MKTKLLKIVRRRYSITKVLDIGSNPLEVYEYHRDVFGYPFYVLRDSRGGYVSRTKFFRTLEEARSELVDYITYDYKKKPIHKDRKEVKVWYTT